MDTDSIQEIQNVFRDLTGDVLDLEELRRLEKNGVPKAEPSKADLPNPENNLEWLTYSLISRALRQADSNSFVRHEPHKEANEN